MWLGRIFAHFRYIELQNFIKKVRENEGTLKKETKSEEEEIDEMMQQMESASINI